MLQTADAIHDPVHMAGAGSDLLSLALIDARNHTLRWLSAFEPHLAALETNADVDPPLWLVGHAALVPGILGGAQPAAERGESADATRLQRLASISRAPTTGSTRAATTACSAGGCTLPDAAALRQYLAESLDATLDLLAGAEDSDASLHVFAWRCCTRTACASRWRWPRRRCRCPRRRRNALAAAAGARRAARAAVVWRAAFHARLRARRPGAAEQRWAHEVQLLEFEIDAQVVSWARYAEFVADGGYDEAQWWSDEGWAWVQAEARRAPRYVEQMRQGVLVHRPRT